MFDDYLISAKVYDQLEKYFIEVFEGEVKKNKINKAVFSYPHYNNYCVDGTRLMDADPMFSARAKTTGNILRVSIYENICDYSVIHNTTGENDELDELLLAMKVEHIERARKDISDWVKRQV